MSRSAAPRAASRFPAPAKAAAAWPRVAVVLAAAAVVLAAFSAEVSDPDFWWHLKTGEYVWQNRALPAPDPFAFTTYSSAPVYPGEEMVRDFNLKHEWLAQAALYMAYRAAGFPGVILLRQLLLTALCVLVGLVVWRRCGGFYRALAAAMATASVAAFVASDRPYLVTFLFLAASIAILEYRRWLWLLPPMLLVWANCHSGFFLGWVVMGAYCAEALIDRWRGRPAADERRLLAVTFVAVLASAVNPTGLRVFQALLLYRQSPMQSAIIEWKPPKFWELSSFTVVLYSAAAVLAWARRRVRLTDWLLFALFAAAALTAARNIILVGIIGGIVLGSYAPSKRALPLGAGFLALLLAAGGFGWRQWGGAFRYRATEWVYPSGAADFLLRHNVSGPMFNVYEHGGYLIWRLWPLQRVFMDGRALNETAFEDGRRIAFNAGPEDGRPGAEDLLDRYGIQVILMPLLDSAGAVYLLPAALADPVQKEWKLVYRDAAGVVFMRRPPPGVQPLDSLHALVSMEEQCSAILNHGGYPGCARSIADVFARIGDPHRAAHWTRIFNQHPRRFHQPIEVR